MSLDCGVLREPEWLWCSFQKLSPVVSNCRNVLGNQDEMLAARNAYV